jgi:hypothetical protein
VAKFSVNVPYWDQWELVSFFQKISTGKANFGDFFAQHNEHRIVFPRIIFAALAFISQWNIKYELLFSIFLAIVNFYVICRISYNQTEIKDSSLAHFANILTCVLFFSLVQWENWLWGFQVAWFLINACVTIAIFILGSSNTRSTSTRFSFAAILCFIASFSSAHGLLSWLAVIPLVASLKGNPRQKVRRTLLWIVLFTASCAIYSVGYVKPSYHPSIFFFLKHPLMTVQYFFSFLGSPLSLYYPAVIGFIILSNFLFFTIYFIKERKSSFRYKAAPWLSLGLFAILFAFMTTVGRAGFGVEQAFSSRYTTTSTLLIISLVQMWCLFVCRIHTEKSLSRKIGYKISIYYKFFAVILTCFVLLNSLPAIEIGHQEQVQKQISKTCLELIHYFTDESSDKCLRKLYSSPSEVRKRAEILERINFRHFPTDIAFSYKPVIDVPFTNEKRLTIKRSVSVSIAGVSLLPDNLDFPTILLLSYGNKKYFFTSIPVNLDSHNFVNALSPSRYIKVRWEVNFSPKLLPLGETVVRAWVYDIAKKQFVKLIGEPKVKVVQ